MSFPKKISLLLALLASPLCALAAAAEPHDLRIFLLIGQSNMAGRAPVEAVDQVPHPRVFTLTKELTWVPAVDPLHFDKPAMVGVGPGLSFARTVADAEPGEVIGLVPAAFGGSSLDEWKPDGDHFRAALERTRTALKSGRLVGILWHQGESDSTPEKAATYAVRFAKLAAQLRADLDAPELPIIVGETGQFRPDANPINAVLSTLPQTIPHCAFVSAEGLTDKGDKLHFDSASQRELGRRYARAWFALSGRKSPPMANPTGKN